MHLRKKGETKMNILLVGVAGYGALYAEYLFSGEFNNLKLAGVVDPYAESSRLYSELKAKAPISPLPIVTSLRDIQLSNAP